MSESSDLVFYMDEPWHDELDGAKDPGWYFWDETRTSALGPFDAEEDCRAALEDYVKRLNTRVVSGFPGVGKTHCYNEEVTAYLDSDSSQFSWSEPGVRNPQFPKNYIEHIKESLGQVSLIFVSSHKDVRDALVAARLQFTLVYPETELKEEYLQRFRDRGSDVAFVDLIAANWDKWMLDLNGQTNCKVIKLKAGEYLSDVIERGDLR